MARIGIFGGSFNPPHRGHLLAAQEQKKRLRLDRVILIPASLPPHKQLADESPSAALRYAMTEALVAKDSDLAVSDIELQREGVSYTADTITELRKRYPNDEFFLMMGVDMFLSLHTWYHPEEIFRHATICMALRAAPSHAEAEKIRLQKQNLEQMGAKVVELNNVYAEMSSTLVRRMLHFDCAEAYLTPEVLEIIRKNGLYGIGDDLKNLPFEALRECSLALHREGRRAHVVGCSETAKKLAERWGADPVLAARAGILHDITKALDKQAHLALCEKYGVELRPFEVENDKLLHAKSGAAVARGVFGECAEVVSAIFWHTTGKADMTLLEKILYLADYMEPNRRFDGVDELRRLAWSDIDRAMLHSFRLSVNMLEERGKRVDQYSREALTFMQAQIEKR